MIALACCAMLGIASGAQAIVIDAAQIGQATQPSVSYDSSQVTNYAGVALAPGTTLGALDAAQIPTVTLNDSEDDPSVALNGPCIDPNLSSDFGSSLPINGLCWHNGSVIHQNETFALTWDPDRRYWETTRNYIEQFLSDVAAGSGSGSSPFALTSQYTDSSGRAKNQSVFGGGCIDYGDPGGYTCEWGDTNGNGEGNNYPSNGCTPTGTNEFAETAYGGLDASPNDICLTDAQIKDELDGAGSFAGMIPLSGMLSRVKSGYTPVVDVLTPPGVEVCLDSAGTLCSANGGSSVQFCSYHSQVNVNGTEVAYVVQPWTAETGCDDPGVPDPGQNPPPTVLAQNMGARLVSPLSQGEISAIVNPYMNGWYGLGGAEIDDNGCEPLPDGLDSSTVGTSSQNPYFLQREFNNGGAIQTDPNSLLCEGQVALEPAFVAPSAINQGDEIQLDGSTTVSTLLVPKENYVWNFGDGVTAQGPSVVHTYSKPGSYTVTLTVTDRGGNTASETHVIDVVGGNGPTKQPTPKSKLKVHLQLMPQSLHSVLGSGISIHVTSNESAAGFVTVAISRGEARKAHIKGHGARIVIGRGTVAGLKDGTAGLHLKLSGAVAKKLKQLRHVTLTIRFQLIGAGGDQVAIDVAGQY